MSEPVKHVPGRLGLSLSGGGLRAAGFHLGTLAYLDRSQLLARVTMLSTVSGGTITGASYALSLAEGTDFNSYLRNYYGTLERNELFQRTLEILGSGQPPDVPSRRHNLITSLASAYAEQFFHSHALGRPYRLSDIMEHDEGNLQEITFNATDFRSGIAFRFQKSQAGRIGNYYTKVEPDAAADIRIADIVAASSCFPGGFEPLKFPDDFAWPAGKQVPVPADAAGVYSVPLMDGGVYDNQGIDSLLLADKRTDPQQTKRTLPQFEAFIISDTDRPADSLYDFPAPIRATDNRWLRLLLRWNPTIGVVNILSRIVQILCILFLLLVGVDLCFDPPEFTTLASASRPVTYLAVFLLSLLVLTTMAFVRNQIRTVLLPQIPVIGFAGWQQLKGVHVDQLIDMVNLRFTSLLAMASQVFMKRIRQLGYRLFYDDSRYDGQRIANFVYHLLPGGSPVSDSLRLDRNQTEPGGGDVDEAQLPEPGPQLQAVIRCANAMDTTLWLNADYELPALVAAGQATLCFNLLKFIARMPKKARAPEVQQLWDRLLADWRQLTDDPYCLLREQLGRDHLPLPPQSQTRF